MLQNYEKEVTGVGLKGKGKNWIVISLTAQINVLDNAAHLLEG